MRLLSLWLNVRIRTRSGRSYQPSFPSAWAPGAGSRVSARARGVREAVPRQVVGSGGGGPRSPPGSAGLARESPSGDPRTEPARRDDRCRCSVACSARRRARGDRRRSASHPSAGRAIASVACAGLWAAAPRPCRWRRRRGRRRRGGLGPPASLATRARGAAGRCRRPRRRPVGPGSSRGCEFDSSAHDNPAARACAPPGRGFEASHRRTAAIVARRP
jgi:hypothetical protein